MRKALFIVFILSVGFGCHSQNTKVNRQAEYILDKIGANDSIYRSDTCIAYIGNYFGAKSIVILYKQSRNVANLVVLSIDKKEDWNKILEVPINIGLTVIVDIVDYDSDGLKDIFIKTGENKEYGYLFINKYNKELILTSICVLNDSTEVTAD
ncbi:hypothetical protein MYP_3628 [Sporocytophaga myxococcoides]|uniref:VCBS repeat-containing protein n=1 Tax=Sporocytophaga myxococcoides TaxID=153721 RepID=A0A098LIW4_9BACT|nr:hypothetical protein [Sporocytophaga myxococcoides]GAL86399.1 hypothetical protein MYP_3628 [Sporocytophaga myxococcoides]